MPDLPFSLGARFRAPDPAEDKYHLSRVVDVTTADLTQARSLAAYKGVDVRPPIEDQGSLGACAAYSAICCARICDVVSGRETASPMLAGDALYAAVRKVEKTFPQDAGSYPADCLDLLMNHGAPLESECPEHHDAAYDYGAQWDTDATPHAFVAAHHPFYPADGHILENIWLALDAGMPVQLAVAWPQSWFNPHEGMVGNDVSNIAGGHAIYIYGWLPSGWVMCANQWGTGWSADAVPSFGYQRPGDFAIPASVFTRPDTNVWECRAVNAKPFTPDPKPLPVPQTLEDRFWRWTIALGQYCATASPDMRRLEAQVLDDTTEMVYTGVK